MSDDRALPTSRRESAVKHMLANGYTWTGKEWVQSQKRTEYVLHLQQQISILKAQLERANKP